MNGMMTGVLLDGMNVGMNLNTGAAEITVALNFGPDGAGHGRFYRTASGGWIPDGGAWQFQGYHENGLLRSLNGRLTGLHKVLCSAAEIACKGRQYFYLGSARWFHDSSAHQNWL